MLYCFLPKGGLRSRPPSHGSECLCRSTAPVEVATAVMATMTLAGNVADMSRHVADDTPCRSNFGQMGPCRRHNFFDVVGVCVGSSRHLLDFSEFVCRNILWWYGGTYAQILSTHSVMFSRLSCSPVCHDLHRQERTLKKTQSHTRLEISV